MADGAKRTGHALGGLELGRMALAIAHRQRIGLEALGLGHGENGGGIKPARKQNNGAFGHDGSRAAQAAHGNCRRIAYFSATGKKARKCGP
ncbi:hypothetical protein GCM10027081_46820 [Cupriavidus yeoncheonensis]